MKKEIAIYGAGGLGREVLALIRQTGEWKPIGFIDDFREKGILIDGIPVLGGVADAKLISNLSVVVAIGDPSVKKDAVMRLGDSFAFPSLIHPSSQIMDTDQVRIGSGSIVSAGVIITTSVTIGNHVLLNLNTTIGHDSVVGSYSSVMPGVNIAGQVTVGEKVLLGSGCNIMNGTKIGDAARVGMGAVVLKDVIPGETVVGVPARPVKSR